jgi:dTDP-4-dehydrorhamnose reductase
MNILLTGAAGRLGQALRHQLPAGIGPTGCSMAAAWVPPLS